jgi:DNA-binding transcriptional ArsR family regulator
MSPWADSPLRELAYVADRRQATELLHPLRLRILNLARRPSSATELGKRLGLPRQRVNYHVRALARSGLLRPAGRRRKRNMIEQHYVASASAYVLSPEVLGPMAADWRGIQDTASAAYQIALAEQVRADVARAWQGAEREKKRLPTLSVKSQFRFQSAEERESFARALQEALVEVIARHTSPNLREDGSAAPGRAYRLVLTCYPYVPEPKKEEGG